MPWKVLDMAERKVNANCLEDLGPAAKFAPTSPPLSQTQDD
jgi:hypothetical protein